MTRRRTLLALLAVGLAAVALWRPAAEAPAPRRRPAPVAAPVVPPTAAPAAVAPAPPTPEPRRRVARELPADTFVGRWVQEAMAKPGDSDPRLLRALGALGLRPGWLSGPAAALDPWVAVALVDLDRQVARRCVADGRDPERCFSPVLETERAVREALDGHPAGEAVGWFLEHDRRVVPAGAR